MRLVQYCTNGRRRTIRTDVQCTSIDVTSRWYKNNHFILPSQASQVFYLQDTKLGEPWKIVQSIQQRGVFNVSEVGVENPMIMQKIVTHSNKKRLLMLSLSMLRIILLTIVWVMLKLRLFLKVELQEMLMKMKSMTYLMLILIWIMICRVHKNCLKCCVLVLKFYACLSSNCFVLILNLIWILMWPFVVLS